MPAPPISDAVLLELIRLVKLHGNVSAVARATNINRATLKSRLEQVRARWPNALPPARSEAGWASQTADTPGEKPRIRIKAGSTASTDAAASAPPVNPLDIRREQDLIGLLKRRNREMETELIAEQDWRRKMEALQEANMEPANWLPAPHVASRTVLTPMLFTSDFQVGEVVRPEEIDGINEYNQDIFVERYQLMIDKTIVLSASTGGTEFPGCVYLRGGDALSGEIHDELAETNDLSSVPACATVYRQEKAGIRRLRDKYGRVRVVSIPGNHGRTTHKPRAKGYVERNYETLLAWWLASAFEDDPSVTFYTPKSGDAFFNVVGWNFLMAHGDRMGSKGGKGFIGPVATIARGHTKLYQNWSTSGRRVDCILTGHLHTSCKLERGYGNGSIVGYGEYARDIQAIPAPAYQWLFFIHAEKMISHSFELQLNNRPFRSLTEPTSNE